MYRFIRPDGGTERAIAAGTKMTRPFNGQIGDVRYDEPVSLIDSQGRRYNCGPGSFVDVPESQPLNSAVWISLGESGPTSARPQPALGMDAGRWYLDSTLNAMVVFDGATWRSPFTGQAA